MPSSSSPRAASGVASPQARPKPRRTADFGFRISDFGFPICQFYSFALFRTRKHGSTLARLVSYGCQSTVHSPLRRIEPWVDRFRRFRSSSNRTL
jgi:hypothetical protein